MKAKIFCLTLILCLGSAYAAFAGDAAGLTVEPQAINIDAFYDGTTITATGEAPADCEAVLRFLGASCDLHMKKRGKVFGMLWMNLDSLIFRGIPSVCIVNTPPGLEGSADKANPESGVDSLRLSAIGKSTRIESNGSDPDGAFAELLKLKQAEGLYRELARNVTYGPASNGVKSFRAEIPVPARLSPGDYLVELTLFKEGRIAGRSVQPVEVNLVGFPGLISNLAFGHSALYGILSAIIAILAGLAIGFAFQGKGGAH
jgi:hypothetical protein